MEDLSSRITNGSNVDPWRVNGNDRIEVLSRLLLNPEHVLRTEPEVFSKVMTNEDAEVINVCLPYVSNLNALLNREEMTALHLSAERGLEEVASKLLELGARTECGAEHTPLHIAADKGNPKMIELLLRHGASVNTRDWLENTPLLALLGSFGSQNYKCTKILLESGSEVNIHNLFCLTPLTDSLMRGCSNYQLKYIFRLLFKAGADPNLADPWYGDTALHYLALSQREESEILAAAEILLNEGACINTANHKGETPLYYAFATRRWFLVDFLVENGADLNFLVENGGDLNFLIENGVDLNGNLQMLIYIKSSMLSTGYIMPTAYNLATSSALKLKCSSRSTKELLLLSHFALKIVKGSHVCERAMECIERQVSLKNFMETCIEEVNALKARTIEGTNLTFCDIVHCDRTTISKYRKNNNLVRALNADHKSFPIYGRSLKRRLDQMLSRQEEENCTFDILSEICDFAPRTFLDEMMDQFSSTERKILIEAFKKVCSVISVSMIRWGLCSVI